MTTVDGRPYISFEIRRRPWTVNAQRNMHHMVAARLVKVWRELAAEACADKPAFDGNRPVTVAVYTALRTKRSQDCGAAYPAVKAAIDGMVDAGIIPDDTPQYLAGIIMFSPTFGAEDDSMIFVVSEER